MLTETGYVGRELHRAARIASAGHGGQIVLSKETTTHAGEGFSFSDLGEHRFKDFSEPVSIYQLGEASFPPLKTISNTNLPRPASSFVGREAELAEVLARVQDGARLVTLTGSGGSGKTRLALEAAASLVPEYKAGVFWVGLASLRDSALVTETISQTLGAKDGLAEHIGEREMLLLLDNLEQVIEAAPELSSLLSSCPNLTLVVTSRELLRVRGEVEYPVLPLAEPEAVSLFCERAQVEPSDEIAELCVRLDSLPLAVELAAARAKALSPTQILERLSSRLDLLKGGRDADPRQQTLRATIGWSYDLLSPEDEQQLFARLSVFAGGCTLEAAEEVCDADLDTLQSLVEKSLLRYTNERYWMLETIREYASECLGDSAEGDQLHYAHSEWYGRLAESIAAAVRQYEPDALALVDQELPNMRAGFAYAVNRLDPRLAGLHLFGLWKYWLIRGHGREAATAATRWLELDRSRLEPGALVRALLAVSQLARFTELGRSRLGVPKIVELMEELLDAELRYPHANPYGMSSEEATAATLSHLSSLELDLGHVSVARSRAEEALAIRRRIGDPEGVGHALLFLAAVAMAKDDVRSARAAYLEASEAFRTAGSAFAPAAEVSLAEIDLLLGNVDAAALRLMQSIDGIRQFADRSQVADLAQVAGRVALALGDPHAAARLLGASRRILAETEVSMQQASEIEGLEVALEQASAELRREDLSAALVDVEVMTDDEILDLAAAAMVRARMQRDRTG